jgi:LysM repeat protein
VAELQSKLATLGYDPGPVDGRFGTLTEEAVFQLQADYRLRQDGIAGPQVARLAGAGFLAALRVVHPVTAGEDLYALAERYGVSPALLRRQAPGRGRALEPGGRLVIPVRPLLAAVEPEDLGRVEELRRTLSAHRTQVTALLVPWFRAAGEGEVGGRVEAPLWDLGRELRLPLVARAELAAPDGLVPTGRRRQRAVAVLAAAAARYRWRGLHLSFPALAPGERFPAAALVSALRRAVPAATLLYLEVPAGAPTGETLPTGESVEPARTPSPPEAAALADLLPAADRLVVRFTTSPASSDRLALRRLLRRHPSYRLFLGLPAAGLRADLAARLSLVTGLSLAGAALWGLGSGTEAVFRAVADLFGVQGSEAWAAGRRNIDASQA